MSDVGTQAIRVCIGTEPKTYIAQKVLESSIRRRTNARVEITPLIGPRWEYPPDLPVGTGFSLRRWMIPAYFGWQGRALYLDADQIVLDDIERLWALADQRDPDCPEPAVWCTYQPDKFSATPWPQTSVMLIDCARARGHWGFEIDRVVAHLRDATKEVYARFMHADWLAGRVSRVPAEWNHLNRYVPARGAAPIPRGGEAPGSGPPTRLLHFTKEPEQPWYRPDHPLAHLWKIELATAIRAGLVTEADLREALGRWEVREDWRPTNGLHPDYADFVGGGLSGARYALGAGRLQARPRGRPPGSGRAEGARPGPPARARAVAAPPRREIRPLWVTSFAADMYAASGRHLIDSFRARDVVGTLLVLAEAVAVPGDPAGRVLVEPLDDSAFLRDWLRAHADITPTHLGGTHDGRCRCPGGPYAVRDKRHRQPCVAQWFNRNASRWFRKVAALERARALVRRDTSRFDAVIWLDADCSFRASVAPRIVEGWFGARDNTRTNIVMRPDLAADRPAAAFYLKHRRPVLEAGCFGIHFRGGGSAVLDGLIDRYASGRFRQDARWDDSFQLQAVLEEVRRRQPRARLLDLAYGVDPAHAEVFPLSALGGFLMHAKGRHGRQLGLMT